MRRRSSVGSVLLVPWIAPAFRISQMFSRRQQICQRCYLQQRRLYTTHSAERHGWESARQEHSQCQRYRSVGSKDGLGAMVLAKSLWTKARVSTDTNNLRPPSGRCCNTTLLCRSAKRGMASFKLKIEGRVSSARCNMAVHG